MGFSRDDPMDKVDAYLRKEYGLPLHKIDYAFGITGITFGHLRVKRDRSYYKREVEKLSKQRRILVEHIDDFLSRTGLWEAIQDLDVKWTVQKKISYIQRTFNLNHVDRMIEKQCLYHKEMSELFRDRKIITEDKRKGVKASTLLSLVWYLLIISTNMGKKKPKTRIFEDISELSYWFSINEKRLINRLFRKTDLEIDTSIIKTNYIRYIRNPTLSQSHKDFLCLADSIVSSVISEEDD